MLRHDIGIDLGGTNLRAALVDTRAGEVLAARAAPTLSRQGYRAVLTRMANLVEEVITEAGVDRAEIGGVGFGLPGRIGKQPDTIAFLPNLEGRWENVSAGKDLAKLLGLPVVLINDVRAITYGEWAFGAGRGYDTVACFALGTGVGGGVIVNGRLHWGVDGTAGELGHQLVELDGLPCGCGGKGCVEVYASGPAIAAAGAKAVMQGLTTRIVALVEGDLNRVTPAVVAQAAWEGDQVARAIFERAGTYLGMAAANIVVTLSPQRIILTGGVAAAGELLFEPVRRTLRERVFLGASDVVQVVPAELGDQAGMLGAALWAHTRRSAGCTHA
jgi:glucokinase